MVVHQCNTSCNSKGVHHVKGKWMSWANGAVPLSLCLSLICVPLFPTLLLSSTPFFFSPPAKAYSPEFYYDTPNPTLSQKQSKNYSYVLQWTQKEPDAVDPILKYRLEVRQVRSALLESSTHAFGKRTSQDAVGSMSSCQWGAEGDEIARSSWSCTFLIKWKRQASCTALHLLLHLVLGTIKGFQGPAASHQTVHAQCFEWGFNVNKTPWSLVAIVDSIGQRLKQVEFHTPHLFEIKRISWRALQAGTAGKSHQLFVLEKGFHTVTVMKLFRLCKLSRGREVGFKVSESEEKLYGGMRRENWGESKEMTGWRRLGKKSLVFLKSTVT